MKQLPNLRYVLPFPTICFAALHTTHLWAGWNRLEHPETQQEKIFSAKRSVQSSATARKCTQNLRNLEQRNRTKQRILVEVKRGVKLNFTIVGNAPPAPHSSETRKSAERKHKLKILLTYLHQWKSPNYVQKDLGTPETLQKDQLSSLCKYGMSSISWMFDYPSF